MRKAACLPRRVSETSLKGLLPFPVPEQFSPVAAGTLQTWPTGFHSTSIVMHLLGCGVHKFLCTGSKKVRRMVPTTGDCQDWSPPRLYSGRVGAAQGLQHVHGGAITPKWSADLCS